MQQELLKWLPDGSSCEIIRVPRGKTLLTNETIPAYRELTIASCAKALNLKFDRVAYGCTAAGFIMGPIADLEMAQCIASITGKPVITTASSMVRALQDMGAKNISLLTPYQNDVNDQLRLFLKAGGIEVRHFDSFYAPDVVALGKITASEVSDKAKALLYDDVDALFIACSQLPTFEVIAPLSKTFGKPVLSSIQVTAKYLLQDGC